MTGNLPKVFVPSKVSLKMGKLAKDRKAAQVSPEPNLLWQAMEEAPGYTYPTLGKQLVLFGNKAKMSREVHVQQGTLVTQILIRLPEDPDHALGAKIMKGDT